MYFYHLSYEGVIYLPLKVFFGLMKELPKLIKEDPRGIH